MNRPIFLIAVLLTPLSPVSAGVRAPEPTAPVAIVAALRGEATSRVGTMAQRVRRFDRFGTGAMLETGPDGELVIVFRSGARVRVRGNSRVRIEDGRADRLAGVIETLTPVPTVPLVPALAGRSQTTTAVRIRAGQMTSLHPNDDARTRADATVLEFAPVGAREYGVEIEDASATVTFRRTISGTRVEVPSGILVSGADYVWRVVAHMPSGFNLQGEGRFRTLNADDTAVRGRLRAAIGEGDADSAALLAEVDGLLGLTREALDGFRAARAAGAADAVIDERIADLERRVSGITTAPPRR
jgi:hypothetical protein